MDSCDPTGVNAYVWTNPNRRPTDTLRINGNGKAVIIQPNHAYYLSLCWIQPGYRQAALAAMQAGCVPYDVYLFFEKDGSKPKPFKEA